MDDTFVIQLESQKEEFFHHINHMDTSIKFTMEEAGPDGSIPFLDLLITPEADGTLTKRYIGNQPTLTNIFSGIATTIWPPNTV